MSESSAVIHGREVIGPIQFASVYLYDLRATRTALAAGTPPSEPEFEPSIAHYELSDDNLRLIVILRGIATVQFRETAKATVDASVLGEFKSAAPIDIDAARQFAYKDAMLLLWPYLRAQVANTAVAMQVEFPPVPIISAAGLLQLINERLPPLRSRRGSPKRPRGGGKAVG